MLNDVTFIQYEGGLARTLTNEDHVSGLISISERNLIAVFYSLQEAEAEGLTAAIDPGVHFQIAQYFAMQPQGELYVYLSDEATSINPTAVSILQNYADGRIRQVAVLSPLTFDTSLVTALQAAAEALKADHMGLSILLAANFTGFTLSTLPSLTTLDAPNVSVIISNDAVTGHGCAGAALGTVSAAKVSENIGWLKKFNVATGVAFQTPKFTTGELAKNVTNAQLSAVKNKGYVFLRKYVGYDGSYFSDSNTATAQSSDYAFIENVRTIEKAERSLRVALMPELGAPLKTKAGKLALETITKFELLVKNRLEQMQNEDEIAEFSVFINPNQNVLSTSQLNIQVGITPYGVARQIVVGIGFEVKAN